MKDKALRLALEALGHFEKAGLATLKTIDAITAIKQALEQPEPEPVATLWQHGETGRTRITMPGDITDCDARWFKAADLYTSPPKREWQGLTDEDKQIAFDDTQEGGGFWEFADAIEAKLKEKNT